MLPELIAYLSTACPRPVRRMGYLSEAIALGARYRRCGKDWQSHLENSRRMVLEASSSCRDRRSVVILGSGLLLDVPLPELAGLFHEVRLVDIVHLPQVRRQVRPFTNVRLVEDDVSTVASRLFENLASRQARLPAPLPAHLGLGGDVSLVVSLNILSQLPVLPRRYALRNMPGLGEEETDAWCRRVIEAHYRALETLACDVCLIADQGYRKLDRQGVPMEQATTLYGFEPPPAQSGWIWRIAPQGELSRAFAKELLVGAWFRRGASPFR